ncbi:unnamed protein product [Phyllotreta striolata]|uniref:Complex I assembly factor TIMMDC1, mitochondrial n=1 Tax=Phyllotreta striolata TaxID=444603 RepID=A0A9N9TQB8_PHYSR|nr:unnamed protein product [Phyllotreta striolata]
MISTLRHTSKHCLYSFSIISLFGGNSLDQVPNENSTVPKEETGWDRLKKMFTVDEFGNLTHEVRSIVQVGCMSVFVGALYGGIMSSKNAYLEFMRSNEATKFEGHLDAKKKLQHEVTTSFSKGALKWGWRLTLFSTTFVGISTLIQTYRDKSGISEYVVAGGLSGFLYKFNAGPRAWIVGGGLGSVLGLFCGVSTTLLLKLSGISMKEARYWQNHWQDARLEYGRKELQEYLHQENFAVISLHDDEIGERGKNIANLEDVKEVEANK